MSGSAAGALLGLLAGTGCWLVVAGLPWFRRPTLDDRIAPYLGLQLPSASASAASPGVRFLAGPAATAGRRVERLLAALGSDPASVRSRLARSGNPLSFEEFRAQQVLSGAAGTALGAVATSVLVAGPGIGPVRGLVLLLVCGLGGLLLRDQLLSLRVRRRADRLLDQFPAVAELLALSVGAGEGAVGALDRVARTCRGDLAEELRLVLADTRGGLPVAQALERMADRLRIPGISVFVDGVVVALERGTPLAEVLRAQAQDVRVASRRRLMESGGRREVLMMVPVVFLILPVTVLFAVYPGLAVLDLDL